MSKIKSNQITSRAHRGTLVIGDVKDKVQFHHEAEVFIPGYATKEYVDDVAANVMPHENPVFHLNDTELFVDYQIPSGKNAGTFGPLLTEASVNVPEGSTWTIVGEDDTTAHAGYLRDLLDTDIPMVPNNDSYLHYDAYTDKWKPKTLTSLNGNNGNDGEDGDDGASAYEIAVENGFVGTEQEWLASLKGEQGDPLDYNDLTPEQIEALKGDKGDDGLSAYEVAVRDGFTGTEAQWLASLKGEKGDIGVDGKGWKSEGTGYDSASGKVTFASDDGLGFATGDLRGEKGTPGDGIHIKGSVDDKAELPDSGNEVGDAYINNSDGDLYIWGDDGTWHDAGHVVGPQGPPGEDGQDGKDGTSLSYDDLTPEQIESIKGEQGDTGANSYEFWLQSNPGGTEAEYWESLKGEKGDTGDDLTYDDLTPEQLASLKGDKGDTGEGQTVAVGDVTTVDPKEDGTHGNASITTNDKLTTEQNLVLDFAIPAGDTGLDGLPGPSGDSAYTVAVNNGFVGTEEEWLASLKGEDGDLGDPRDHHSYASYNTFIGERTPAVVPDQSPPVPGHNNTGLGWSVLRDITKASSNVAVGSQALMNLKTGDRNVAIGEEADLYRTSGTNNITIGHLAQSSAENSSNEITLGSQYNNKFRIPGIKLEADSSGITIDGQPVGGGYGGGDLHVDGQLTAAQPDAGDYALAIGASAGQAVQGAGSISVGRMSGETAQGSYSVAIGYEAGRARQGANCIAIGDGAGYNEQPANSIAIGASSNPSSENSIQLKANTTTFDITPTEVLHNGQPIGGGRIVNTGTIYYPDVITITPNTTNHKVIEWTIDKVNPKNKVMCTVVLGGIFTRTKSTSTSSGVVALNTYISTDGGSTSISGEQVIGCGPPSNISNPRDNWIKGQSVHTLEINNHSQQLNLSLSAVTYGDTSSDVIQINNTGALTTLTWFEIEEI